MRKNVGRPPKAPTTDKCSLTLILPSHIKSKLITDSQAYDMTLTEYLISLIERNN